MPGGGWRLTRPTKPKQLTRHAQRRRALQNTPLLTLRGQEMAELTVNGQPAGVSFWSPHTFPLAGLLTPGENTLTLTLTGSPANRYGKHPVPYGLER